MSDKVLGAVIGVNMAESNPILTEAEAAAYLRVSRATVRREREAGALSFVGIRGRVFYRLSDIEEYLTRCRVDATPRPGQEQADINLAVARARNAVRSLRVGKRKP